MGRVIPAETDQEVLRMRLAAMEDPSSNDRFWRPRALADLELALPEKVPLTVKREAVRQALVQYLREGYVPNRIQGDEDPLWEFRIVVMQKNVYVKVALEADDPDMPGLEVVSFHLGWW